MVPGIGGTLVAREDKRDGNKEIYVRDLATSVERRVTDSPDFDSPPAVSTGTIVFQRAVPSGFCDIYAYDWATMTSRQITNTPADDERNPAINGNVRLGVRNVVTAIQKDLARN
jgi:Tol biopolymer transport system component